MKKIFISMPMREKTIEEISAEREKLLERAGEYLKAPVELVGNCLSHELSPLECLGESIKRMATADYVLFADGYENARGCEIEFTCAQKYDKKILVEHGNKIEEEV